MGMVDHHPMVGPDTAALTSRHYRQCVTTFACSYGVVQFINHQTGHMSGTVHGAACFGLLILSRWPILKVIIGCGRPCGASVHHIGTGIIISIAVINRQ